MLDASTWVIVVVTFVLAGAVKGVIGLGLPTVSLGLLTATVGLQPAMAVLLAPSFVTNLWQALVGGHGRTLLRRLWPFLLTATLAVGIGAAMSSGLDVTGLSGLLGLLLCAYACTGLSKFRLQLPLATQRWAGPATGTMNGVLTGLTGSFVVPGVLYLQSIGLQREPLIQAMGILFTLSTVALGVALGGRSLLSMELGLVSLLAVVPAMAGMVLGQRLRRRLSEARFRQVFFVALLLLGLYITIRSVLASVS